MITDLLDEAAFPAEDMLATYHKRWGIETVFHQITDVFSLRHLIGSSPQAVLFQFSLCLLLYNTLQVLRAHLAAHQKCEAKKISNEKLFYDVKRQLVSVSELVAVHATCFDLLGEVPTAVELARPPEREPGRGVEQSLVEGPEFARRRAQEGENAGARQPYVDLPGPSTGKNVNRSWYHL